MNTQTGIDKTDETMPEDKAIRNAIIAALFVAAVNLALILFNTELGSFFIVTTYSILALGLWYRSRVAALALFLLYVGEQVITYEKFFQSFEPGDILGDTIAVLLLVVFFKGLRAVFRQPHMKDDAQPVSFRWVKMVAGVLGVLGAIGTMTFGLQLGGEGESTDNLKYEAVVSSSEYKAGYSVGVRTGRGEEAQDDDRAIYESYDNENRKLLHVIGALNGFIDSCETDNQECVKSIELLRKLEIENFGECKRTCKK